MELEKVETIMQKEKSRIIGIHYPFSTNPDPKSKPIRKINVFEYTQKSVFLQKEIEDFTTEMKANKNLTIAGKALITHRVHSQRSAGLCVSFSTITCIRGAILRFLIVKRNPESKIKHDLENVTQFSFNKMLTLFTGCVSPRSLDGLVKNAKNKISSDSQAQTVSGAIDRMVNKTEFEVEGWLRITPIVELFKKYKVDPRKIKLEKMPIYHPWVATENQMTFNDAVKNRVSDGS